MGMMMNELRIDFNLMHRLKDIVASEMFEKVILTAIVLNGITLGLETHTGWTIETMTVLQLLDQAFLALFCLELLMKIIVFKGHFFRDPWRVFDLSVITLALLPDTGVLSVLRSLRVLRILRMISVIPTLRKVVAGLLSAIPGLTSVAMIMALIFYVGAVMATKLYGDAFPQWFGNIFASAYTLFQIMTLESWSMGIVRPVMNVFPSAWVFFIPFILIATFTMLNLFIAVIVNAMHGETEESHPPPPNLAEQQEYQTLIDEIRQLRAELNPRQELTKPTETS